MEKTNTLIAFDSQPPECFFHRGDLKGFFIIDERIVSLGNVYVANFQMLNTLGVSKIDSDSVDVLKSELSAARLRAEGELAKAEVAYNTKLSAADKKQSEESKKVFDLVNQPLTTLGNSDYITVGL